MRLDQRITMPIFSLGQMTSTKLIEGDKTKDIEMGSADLKGRDSSVMMEDSFKLLPEVTGTQDVETFRVSRPRFRMTVREDNSASAHDSSPRAKKTLNISFHEVDSPRRSLDSSRQMKLPD